MTREDLGQTLDVGAAEDFLPALVAAAQPVDQLGAQDVDLAVQDAPAVGDLQLLLAELVDQLLELSIVELTEVGEGCRPLPYCASFRARAGVRASIAALTRGSS